MRRKDKEVSDIQIIEEILKDSQICRLAFVDNQSPYLVPLNYGYSNNCLYFHSTPSGKKIECIKANPKVCFEIEYYSEIVKHEISCMWTTKYRSIIGYGIAEIISDNVLKKSALDIIMEHYGRSNDNIYNDRQINNIVIIKVIITELSCKQSGDWS